MTSKDLKNKLVTRVVDSNGEVIYDFTDVIDEIKNKIDTLEKENQELKEDNLQMQGYYDYYSKENIALTKEIDRLKKELKQTKLNFRNSQTHSKNRYKKLKEKYEKLETAYKNNEVMVRDLNELITRNLELKDALNRCQETISAWMENHKSLIIDNGKMKKALDILKEKLEIQLHQDDEYFPIPMINGSEIFQNLTKEEYKLLKEVLQDD